jgi:pyridoxine 5-phosphate synthase
MRRNWAPTVGTSEQQSVLERYAAAALAARRAGLGVNAGHDLNRLNLGAFLRLVDADEVSIGHALIADALEFGLAAAVRLYLAEIRKAGT